MPGKKFPDLTGDGKVTKKDILKARGVPGFQKGGAVKKKKEKEEKPQGVDPLGLMKPKNKIKPFMKSEPLKDLRDEALKQKLYKKDGGMVLEIGLRPASKQEMKMAKEMKPQKKAGGGMMRKGQKGSDAENLKNIETQQQRQSERAKEAEKAVKGYAREKARVRGTGSAISGKNFKGVF